MNRDRSEKRYQDKKEEGDRHVTRDQYEEKERNIHICNHCFFVDLLFWDSTTAVTNFFIF